MVARVIYCAILCVTCLFACPPSALRILLCVVVVAAAASHGYDLSAYESVARSIAKYAHSSTIVVEKSTVPVLTAERIRGVFEANAKPGVQFEILSNPEFLAEGTAIRDLEKPDRSVVHCFSFLFYFFHTFIKTEFVFLFVCLFVLMLVF